VDDADVHEPREVAVRGAQAQAVRSVIGDGLGDGQRPPCRGEHVDQDAPSVGVTLTDDSEPPGDEVVESGATPGHVIPERVGPAVGRIHGLVWALPAPASPVVASTTREAMPWAGR